MDDYIKRRDAIHDIEQIADTMSVCLNRDECNGMRNMKQLSIAAVFQTHAAEVRENVYGQWKRFHKKNGDEGYYEWCECSVCGERATAGPCYFDNETPFCPWCGADMR